MAKGNFAKQPGESFTIAADIEDVIITGETADLASSTVTATDSAGDDASADILVGASKSVSGTQLKIKVKAGTEALSPYTIRFVIGTSEGNIWEKDVEMRIQEI